MCIYNNIIPKNTIYTRNEETQQIVATTIFSRGKIFLISDAHIFRVSDSGLKSKKSYDCGLGLSRSLTKPSIPILSMLFSFWGMSSSRCLSWLLLLFVSTAAMLLNCCFSGLLLK